MNIEQWKSLQPRVVEVQRLALEFAELGYMDVSRLLLQAGMKASKIKPEKPAETAPQKPAKVKA